MEEIAIFHCAICVYVGQALQEDNKKANRPENQGHSLNQVFRSLVIIIGDKELLKPFLRIKDRSLIWGEREALLVRTDKSNHLDIGTSQSKSVKSGTQSEGRS